MAWADDTNLSNLSFFKDGLKAQNKHRDVNYDLLAVQWDRVSSENLLSIFLFEFVFRRMLYRMFVLVMFRATSGGMGRECGFLFSK